MHGQCSGVAALTTGGVFLRTDTMVLGHWTLVTKTNRIRQQASTGSQELPRHTDVSLSHTGPP